MRGKDNLISSHSPAGRLYVIAVHYRDRSVFIYCQMICQCPYKFQGMEMCLIRKSDCT